MISSDDITGLVLAGGRGSRMGHVDKGLVTLHGKPLALHALERLAPQTGRLMIVTNRNRDTYRTFGFRVLSDEVRGFAGPLAGIHAGFNHCETPYMAIVPCDAPLLPHDLVMRLSSAMVEQEADVSIARTMEDEKAWLQPVFALLRVSLLPSLTEFLENGGRKVDAWYSTLNTATVEFTDTTAFRNINTPEELKKLEVV
jgi:molybdopterin-guanine dinucleotide biosynthesis protein A